MARRRQSMFIVGDFEEQLRTLQRALANWSREGRRRLLLAHKRIGARHRDEAQKRVPVDKNRLKPAILTNTTESGSEIVTETGTNVPYGVRVEFGNRYIAGGRVKALGTGVIVTDAQAVKSWPAKEARMQSSGSRATEKENRVAAAKARRAARGGADQQMPWLRPAFESIRMWAIQQIDESLEPPRQGA